MEESTATVPKDVPLPPTTVTTGQPYSGRPPPSPLSGGYLLIVISETLTDAHKAVILQKLAKAFLSWNVEDSGIDIERELAIVTALSPEGDFAKNGERLIQNASEHLVTEILIHPQINTMRQCIRNLLSSFTKYRFIIHAGYVFCGNGSWILQDGTFSVSDFIDAFQEIEVQRVIRAYEKTVKIDICCIAEGGWTQPRLQQEPFSKLCQVEINPSDKIAPGNVAVREFIDYLEQYIIPSSIEDLLEPSDIVGNIRFTHPTLYVFPGGEGDAALFGINGFNMLVDGGFGKKACFWNFVRHLDRLDAVLMTRVNNSNIGGMSGVVERKVFSHVYPQVGHFFSNLQARKQLPSPDGDKDREPLLVNLIEEGDRMVMNLKQLQLKPHHCYRDATSDPINLYHKVGHGKLDMYVISPAKDSREVKEFLSRWNNHDVKLFSGTSKTGNRELRVPLQNLVSICALLVWQPANPDDNITRILFPGSTPQHKIFEGLERLKPLEFLKHSTCTVKSVMPAQTPLVAKPTAKKFVSKFEKSEKIMDELVKSEAQVKSALAANENEADSGPRSLPVDLLAQTGIKSQPTKPKRTAGKLTEKAVMKDIKSKTDLVVKESTVATRHEKSTIDSAVITKETITEKKKYERKPVQRPVVAPPPKPKPSVPSSDEKKPTESDKSASPTTPKKSLVERKSTQVKSTTIVTTQEKEVTSKDKDDEKDQTAENNKDQTTDEEKNETIDKDKDFSIDSVKDKIVNEDRVQITDKDKDQTIHKDKDQSSPLVSGTITSSSVSSTITSHEKDSSTTVTSSKEQTITSSTTATKPISRPAPRTRTPPKVFPAKSLKDENNRKVAESKSMRTAPPKIVASSKPVKKEDETIVKAEKKQSIKRIKPPVPPAIVLAPAKVAPAAKPSSPVKITRKPITILSKKTSVIVDNKKLKPDNEKTDSSAVSTPSTLDADTTLLKTKGKSESIKAKSELMKGKSELIKPKSETIKVKSVESTKDLSKSTAVKKIRPKPKTTIETQPSKVTTEPVSIKPIDLPIPTTEPETTTYVSNIITKQGDDDEDEILIIETTEMKSVPKHDYEEQKYLRDQTESEKQTKEKHIGISQSKQEQSLDFTQTDGIKASKTEDKAAVTLTPEDKEKIFGEVQGIINTATELINTSGKPSIDQKASPTADKQESPKAQVKEPAHGSQETSSTTAPTMPEDEKIDFDEPHKQEEIEEKYDKEETKEKSLENGQHCKIDAQIPLVEQTHEEVIRKAKRDIVKTPDEVADLPVHEEVDNDDQFVTGVTTAEPIIEVVKPQHPEFVTLTPTSSPDEKPLPVMTPSNEKGIDKSFVKEITSSTKKDSITKIELVEKMSQENDASPKSPKEDTKRKDDFTRDEFVTIDLQSSKLQSSTDTTAPEGLFQKEVAKNEVEKEQASSVDSRRASKDISPSIDKKPAEIELETLAKETKQMEKPMLEHYDEISLSAEKIIDSAKTTAPQSPTELTKFDEKLDTSLQKESQLKEFLDETSKLSKLEHSSVTQIIPSSTQLKTTEEKVDQLLKKESLKDLQKETSKISPEKSPVLIENELDSGKILSPSKLEEKLDQLTRKESLKALQEETFEKSLEKSHSVAEGIFELEKISSSIKSEEVEVVQRKESTPKLPAEKSPSPTADECDFKKLPSPIKSQENIDMVPRKESSTISPDTEKSPSSLDDEQNLEKIPSLTKIGEKTDQSSRKEPKSPQEKSPTITEHKISSEKIICPIKLEEKLEQPLRKESLKDFQNEASMLLEEKLLSSTKCESDAEKISSPINLEEKVDQLSRKESLKDFQDDTSKLQLEKLHTSPEGEPSSSKLPLSPTELEKFPEKLDQLPRKESLKEFLDDTTKSLQEKLLSSTIEKLESSKIPATEEKLDEKSNLTLKEELLQETLVSLDSKILDEKSSLLEDTSKTEELDMIETTCETYKSVRKQSVKFNDESLEIIPSEDLSSDQFIVCKGKSRKRSVTADTFLDDDDQISPKAQQAEKELLSSKTKEAVSDTEKLPTDKHSLTITADPDKPEKSMSIIEKASSKDLSQSPEEILLEKQSTQLLKSESKYEITSPEALKEPKLSSEIIPESTTSLQNIDLKLASTKDFDAKRTTVEITKRKSKDELSLAEVIKSSAFDGSEIIAKLDDKVTKQEIKASKLKEDSTDETLDSKTIQKNVEDTFEQFSPKDVITEIEDEDITKLDSKEPQLTETPEKQVRKDSLPGVIDRKISFAESIHELISPKDKVITLEDKIDIKESRQPSLTKALDEIPQKESLLRKIDQEISFTGSISPKDDPVEPRDEADAKNKEHSIPETLDIGPKTESLPKTVDQKISHEELPGELILLKDKGSEEPSPIETIDKTIRKDSLSGTIDRKIGFPEPDQELIDESIRKESLSQVIDRKISPTEVVQESISPKDATEKLDYNTDNKELSPTHNLQKFTRKESIPETTDRKISLTKEVLGSISPKEEIIEPKDITKPDSKEISLIESPEKLVRKDSLQKETDRKPDFQNQIIEKSDNEKIIVVEVHKSASKDTTPDEFKDTTLDVDIQTTKQSSKIQELLKEQDSYEESIKTHDDLKDSVKIKVDSKGDITLTKTLKEQISPQEVLSDTSEDGKALDKTIEEESKEVTPTEILKEPTTTKESSPEIFDRKVDILEVSKRLSKDELSLSKALKKSVSSQESIQESDNDDDLYLDKTELDTKETTVVSKESISTKYDNEEKLNQRKDSIKPDSEEKLNQRKNSTKISQELTLPIESVIKSIDLQTSSDKKQPSPGEETTTISPTDKTSPKVICKKDSIGEISPIIKDVSSKPNEKLESSVESKSPVELVSHPSTITSTETKKDSMQVEAQQQPIPIEQKSITKLENNKDLSSVKRDSQSEIPQIPIKKELDEQESTLSKTMKQSPIFEKDTISPKISPKRLSIQEISQKESTVIETNKNSILSEKVSQQDDKVTSPLPKSLPSPQSPKSPKSPEYTENSGKIPSKKSSPIREMSSKDSKTESIVLVKSLSPETATIPSDILPSLDKSHEKSSTSPQQKETPLKSEATLDKPLETIPISEPDEKSSQKNMKTLDKVTTSISSIDSKDTQLYLESKKPSSLENTPDTLDDSKTQLSPQSKESTESKFKIESKSSPDSEKIDQPSISSPSLESSLSFEQKTIEEACKTDKSSLDRSFSEATDAGKTSMDTFAWETSPVKMIDSKPTTDSSEIKGEISVKPSDVLTSEISTSLSFSASQVEFINEKLSDESPKTQSPTNPLETVVIESRDVTKVTPISHESSKPSSPTKEPRSAVTETKDSKEISPTSQESIDIKSQEDSLNISLTEVLPDSTVESRKQSITTESRKSGIISDSQHIDLRKQSVSSESQKDMPESRKQSITTELQKSSSAPDSQQVDSRKQSITTESRKSSIISDSQHIDLRKQSISSESQRDMPESRKQSITTELRKSSIASDSQQVDSRKQSITSEKQESTDISDEVDIAHLSKLPSTDFTEISRDSLITSPAPEQRTDNITSELLKQTNQQLNQSISKVESKLTEITKKESIDTPADLRKQSYSLESQISSELSQNDDVEFSSKSTPKTPSPKDISTTLSSDVSPKQEILETSIEKQDTPSESRKGSVVHECLTKISLESTKKSIEKVPSSIKATESLGKESLILDQLKDVKSDSPIHEQPAVTLSLQQDTKHITPDSFQSKSPDSLTQLPIKSSSPDEDLKSDLSVFTTTITKEFIEDTHKPSADSTSPITQDSLETSPAKDITPIKPLQLTAMSTKSPIACDESKLEKLVPPTTSKESDKIIPKTVTEKISPISQSSQETSPLKDTSPKKLDSDEQLRKESIILDSKRNSYAFESRASIESIAGSVDGDFDSRSLPRSSIDIVDKSDSPVDDSTSKQFENGIATLTDVTKRGSIVSDSRKESLGDVSLTTKTITESTFISLSTTSDDPKSTSKRSSIVSDSQRSSIAYEFDKDTADIISTVKSLSPEKTTTKLPHDDAKRSSQISLSTKLPHDESLTLLLEKNQEGVKDSRKGSLEVDSRKSSVLLSEKDVISPTRKQTPETSPKEIAESRKSSLADSKRGSLITEADQEIHLDSVPGSRQFSISGGVVDQSKIVSPTTKQTPETSPKEIAESRKSSLTDSKRGSLITKTGQEIHLDSVPGSRQSSISGGVADQIKIVSPTTKQTPETSPKETVESRKSSLVDSKRGSLITETGQEIHLDSVPGSRQSSISGDVADQSKIVSPTTKQTPETSPKETVESRKSSLVDSKRGSLITEADQKITPGSRQSSISESLADQRKDSITNDFNTTSPESVIVAETTQIIESVTKAFSNDASDSQKSSIVSPVESAIEYPMSKEQSQANSRKGSLASDSHKASLGLDLEQVITTSATIIETISTGDLSKDNTQLRKTSLPSDSRKLSGSVESEHLGKDVTEDDLEAAAVRISSMIIETKEKPKDSKPTGIISESSPESSTGDKTILSSETTQLILKTTSPHSITTDSRKSITSDSRKGSIVSDLSKQPSIDDSLSKKLSLSNTSSQQEPIESPFESSVDKKSDSRKASCDFPISSSTIESHSTISETSTTNESEKLSSSMFTSVTESTTTASSSILGQITTITSSIDSKLIKDTSSLAIDSQKSNIISTESQKSNLVIEVPTSTIDSSTKVTTESAKQNVTSILESIITSEPQKSIPEVPTSTTDSLTKTTMETAKQSVTLISESITTSSTSSSSELKNIASSTIVDESSADGKLKTGSSTIETTKIEKIGTTPATPLTIISTSTSTIQSEIESSSSPVFETGIVSQETEQTKDKNVIVSSKTEVVKSNQINIVDSKTSSAETSVTKLGSIPSSIETSSPPSLKSSTTDDDPIHSSVTTSTKQLIIGDSQSTDSSTTKTIEQLSKTISTHETIKLGTDVSSGSPSPDDLQHRKLSSHQLGTVSTLETCNIDLSHRSPSPDFHSHKSTTYTFTNIGSPDDSSCLTDTYSRQDLGYVEPHEALESNLKSSTITEKTSTVGDELTKTTTQITTMESQMSNAATKMTKVIDGDSNKSAITTTTTTKIITSESPESKTIPQETSTTSTTTTTLVETDPSDGSTKTTKTISDDSGKTTTTTTTTRIITSESPHKIIPQDTTSTTQVETVSEIDPSSIDLASFTAHPGAVNPDGTYSTIEYQTITKYVVIPSADGSPSRIKKYTTEIIPTSVREISKAEYEKLHDIGASAAAELQQDTSTKPTIREIESKSYDSFVQPQPSGPITSVIRHDPVTKSVSEPQILTSPDSGALHMDTNQMRVQFLADSSVSSVSGIAKKSSTGAVILKSSSDETYDATVSDTLSDLSEKFHKKEVVSKTVSLPILDEVVKPSNVGSQSDSSEDISRSLTYLEKISCMDGSKPTILSDPSSLNKQPEDSELKSKSVSLPVIKRPDDSEKYMTLPNLYKSTNLEDLTADDTVIEEKVLSTEAMSSTHGGVRTSAIAPIKETDESIDDENQPTLIRKVIETTTKFTSQLVGALQQDSSSPQRSHTPCSEDRESDDGRSDTSLDQCSRITQHSGGAGRDSSQICESDEDEELAGSTVSTSSNLAHFKEDDHIQEQLASLQEETMRKMSSSMTQSFYGTYPDDDDDDELPEDCRPSSTSTTAPQLGQDPDKDDKKDPIKDWGRPLGLPNVKNIDRFLIWNPIEEWGRPLGLPTPAPPPPSMQDRESNGDIEINLAPINPPNNNASKGTPTKKVPKKPVITEKINTARETSKTRDSSVKRTKLTKPTSPVYIDLAYVPHHGNPYYTTVEFFKRIRARYYVFSGTDPSKDVFNALIDAKKTWEDQTLEVTIIPTYDTDVLGYWITENEETLANLKIDLSPSASRCTINLQDHDTSCSAYRLEF